MARPIVSTSPTKLSTRTLRGAFASEHRIHQVRVFDCYFANKVRKLQNKHGKVAPGPQALVFHPGNSAVALGHSTWVVRADPANIGGRGGEGWA